MNQPGQNKLRVFAKNSLSEPYREYFFSNVAFTDGGEPGDAGSLLVDRHTDLSNRVISSGIRVRSTWEQLALYPMASNTVVIECLPHPGNPNE